MRTSYHLFFVSSCISALLPSDASRLAENMEKQALSREDEMMIAHLRSQGIKVDTAGGLPHM